MGNSLSMGEFILMELYRLGDVDEDAISMLKSTFLALDKKHTDGVTFGELEVLDYSSAEPRATEASRRIAQSSKGGGKNMFGFNKN